MKNFSLRAGRFLTLALLFTGLGLSSCKKDETTTVTGNWVGATSFSTFPGVTRTGAVSFVINNVAYVGTGLDGSNGNTTPRLNDFYAFDPSKGTQGSWTRVTPMPAAAGVRYLAAAFAAGGKGYVGTGYDDKGNYLSDMWQFDPAGTTGTGTTATVGVWTRKSDFPLTTTGTGRRGAVAGSVGNFGYMGCGFGGNWENDMYKYDPTLDTWTSTGFTGNKRVNASTFTIGNTLYMGFGTNNNTVNTQFWAYDATAGTWSQKRSLANISTSTNTYDYSGVARTQAVAFAVGSYGYVTVGNNGSNLLTCYVYDPIADTWTLKNPFLGQGRSTAVSFSIGNFGYVGLGNTGSSYFDDFWKFAPDASQD
ncbi:Kelch repeat-containing protein [Hymenobacter bucti]|uniref:Kelch repeat-containing protein n=1 Tax=Hymenobacter bucti TaxID=1844114 RepID=A0ABW4QZS9_9BACT